MRKTLTYTVTDEGRDKGKVFYIEEMSAVAAEKWACRLFFAMVNNGAELPVGIESMGMRGLLYAGITGATHVPWHMAEPLLDDLMACVQVCPDHNNPNVRRKLIDTDISEVETRLMLKKEIFDLHTGFFTYAASLTLGQAAEVKD